jgi:hypothetical protein
MRVLRTWVLVAILGAVSTAGAAELRYGDVVTTIIYPSVIECACWHLQIYRGGADYRSAIEVASGPYIGSMMGAVAPSGDVWALSTYPTQIVLYDSALHPRKVFEDPLVYLRSITFDRASNAYVNAWSFDQSRRILKLDPSGNPLRTYVNPFPDSANIELGQDGCTLYLMPDSWSSFAIHRFDVCSDALLPDIAIPPAPPTRFLYSQSPSLQALPDGSLLLPRRDVILRLSAEGGFIRIYDAPGHDDWRVTARDPDGLSFWAVTGDADADGGEALFRFRLSDGAVIDGPIIAAGRALHSISVVGDHRTRAVRGRR